MATAVSAIKPPVNILSGNEATLFSLSVVVPYFWIFLAIKSRCCTNSKSSSIVHVEPPYAEFLLSFYNKRVSRSYKYHNW